MASFPKDIRKAGLIPFFALASFFLPFQVWAQNTYSVTTDAGDASPGSLGGAVAGLNASGSAGAITFAESDPINLSQPLAPISQSVTFQGSGIAINGSDEAEAQFYFQQSVNQQNSYLTLQNTNFSSGLDLSVTSAGWTMAPNSNLYFYGASAPGTLDSSGTGQTGGNLQFATGNWTAEGICQFGAGAGAAVADNSGTGDQGGTGGSVSLSFGNLAFTGDTFQITAGAGGNLTDTNGSGDVGGTGGSMVIQGNNFSFAGGNPGLLSAGNGGSVTDMGTGTPQGGMGGSVDLSLTGSLSVTYGNLDLTAGNGGSGVTGGAGGGATLTAGSVTLSTILSVQAGYGGYGSSLYGANGAAYVSIGSLQGHGTLFIDGSSALLQVASGDFGGSLEGNEALQVIGSGSLTLSGANFYSGGTSVSGGTLNIRNDDNLGESGTTLTLDGGTLQTSGSLVSDRNLVITSNNGTFDEDGYGSSLSGVISGAGGLMVISSTGSGSLTLSGANSYSGGTSVSGGILNIQDDGNLGAGGTTLTLNGGTLQTSGSLVSGRNLAITSNNGTFDEDGYDSSLSGVISGAGGLMVTSSTGSGSLTLTVANTYAGGTNLVGGTLAVGNSSALGTGSVLVSGGTLESAGFPVGLVIGGNYSQGSGGTLRLGLASFQSPYYDTVNVVGNVSLDGTLSLYSYGGLTPPTLGSSVVVLSSLGILTGTFQQVDENLGDTRLLPLYYNNAVELESIVPSFLALSSTANQKVIGADLDLTVFNPKLMGMMSQLGAMSASSLQTAENEISPEGLSALFQAGFEGAASRAALVDERLSQLRETQQAQFILPGHAQSETPLFAGLQPVEEEASMALPKHEGDWSGFVSGNGGVFNVAGNPNAAGYQMTTYGLTGAGADVRLSPDFALGLMAGFGQSNITLDGGGTLTASGGQLGLYGLFASQGFYADGLVEGGISQYSSLRQSYVGIASGQTPGSEWSGEMELGYGWKVKPMTVGPEASVQYTRVGFNGFSETGSVSPLTYPTQSQDSFMSRLGIRADGKWNLGGAVLSPQLTLAWEHEYDNLGGNVAAGFGAGDSFTVAGPALGQDGLLASAGLDLAFSKDISVALNYQGELGRSNFNSNQFGGGLRLGF